MVQAGGDCLPNGGPIVTGAREDPIYEWPPIQCLVINLDALENDKAAIEAALKERSSSTDTLERLRKVVDWFIVVNNPRTWRPDAPGRK